jgi:hypothetical protein
VCVCVTKGAADDWATGVVIAPLRQSLDKCCGSVPLVLAFTSISKMSVADRRLPVIGTKILSDLIWLDISELDSNPEKLAPEITKACKEWG